MAICFGHGRIMSYKTVVLCLPCLKIDNCFVLNIIMASCVDIIFFIGAPFYLFKARFSVFKSNFLKREFFKVTMATSSTRET